MERKIGEIFEFCGKWYQCLKSDGSCADCTFFRSSCGSIADKGICRHDLRKDATNVIFKKLEKFGEPFSCNYYGNGKLVIMQEYQLYEANAIYNYSSPPMYISDYKHKRIAIEIKQNKEDMEEYKMHDAKEDIPEFDKVVDECLFGKQELKLKPFDLQKAKDGKPVFTRDGRNARIICFDAKGDFPIAALVETNDIEEVNLYTNNGFFHLESNDLESDCDLMMLSEKKEGWVNVYNDAPIYDTKERAELAASTVKKRIGTFKIFWEE